ncbi:MAG TPA: copper chaperone PCu(A)C [Usitatibacter sp.]|nr:copper chaperone PCu(A)C [Usitatibacter sp.]
MPRAALLAAALAFATAASAADLHVSDAWIRLLPGGAPSAGYFTLHNDSPVDVRLESAASPDFGEVSMHRTVEEAGSARMEPVDEAVVPAHGELRFAPGGYHLMMMQPKPGLKPGAQAVVALRLSGGRTLTASFPIRGPAGR